MAIVTEKFHFHRIGSLFKIGSLGNVPGHTKANQVQWTVIWRTEERQDYITYLLCPFHSSHSQITFMSFFGTQHYLSSLLAPLKIDRCQFLLHLNIRDLEENPSSQSCSCHTRIFALQMGSCCTSQLLELKGVQTFPPIKLKCWLPYHPLLDNYN